MYRYLRSGILGVRTVARLVGALICASDLAKQLKKNLRAISSTSCERLGPHGTASLVARDVHEYVHVLTCCRRATFPETKGVF